MISVLLVLGLLYFKGSIEPWGKLSPPVVGVLISTGMGSALPTKPKDPSFTNTQQVLGGKSCAASVRSPVANTGKAASDCSGGGCWIP